MSFAERAASGPPVANRCSVGRLADGLEPTEAEALETMVASESWPLTGPGSITEALVAEGHEAPGEKVLRRHRRRDCRCYRDAAE